MYGNHILALRVRGNALHLAVPFSKPSMSYTLCADINMSVPVTVTLRLLKESTLVTVDVEEMFRESFIEGKFDLGKYIEGKIY